MKIKRRKSGKKRLTTWWKIFTRNHEIMQLTIDSIVEHRGRWMRNNFDNLEKWRNFLASSFKWWLPRDIHNLSIYKETNAIYSFYSISDCQLFLKLRVVNVYREREQIIVIAMRNDFIMSSLKFFFFSLEMIERRQFFFVDNWPVKICKVLCEKYRWSFHYRWPL